jgi:RNA polymerase sigma factor (sigma-70 family)
MAVSHRAAAVQHLLALADAEAQATARDGDLLERFVLHQEEAAFAALVRRHGPMVRAVAQRVLGHVADADDVFQAAFLLLARKAEGIRQGASVGGWLHRVAFRLALEAKAQKQRRQAQERHAAVLRTQEPRIDLAWRELQGALDEELERLPQKYRLVLLLFYWEGKTQEETAHHLGCPLGTVRSRLARARDLLRKRLARRGLALSGPMLTTVLVAGTARAALPVALRCASVNAALAFAAGRAAEGISKQAVLFAERALKGMLLSKLKTVAAVLMILAGVGVGTSGLAFRAQPSSDVPAALHQASPAGSAPAGRADERRGAGSARPASQYFAHDHGGSAWCATAFSADGKMLATCAGSIRVWDPSNGKLLRQIEGRYFTTGSLVFSPDSKLLAAQGEQDICLLDPATGKVLRRLACQGRAFAFSPDSKLLATSGPPGPFKQGGTCAVSLWDTATARQVAVLAGHERVVHSAVFTPDGRTLVSACWGNRICRWDVAAGTLQKSFDLPLAEGRTACLSRDGRTLAVAAPWPAPAGADTIWDTDSAKKLATVPSKRSGTNYGLAFSPDGKVLATDSTTPGDDKATITLWKVAGGQRIKSFTIPARADFVLQFAANGRTLLSSGPEPRVRLWDTTTGQQLPHQRPQKRPAQADPGRR